MSLFDLADRVIVVTGARGFLGRPICAALAEAGATVWALDMSEPEVVADEAPMSPYQDRADVLDLNQLHGQLDMLRTLWGTPYGLITLAGLDAKPGENAADPWRDWQAMVDVNLTGTANACRVFGTAMAEAGRGLIVTVGSLYGALAPDQRLYCRKHEQDDCFPECFTKPAAYSASKAGVLGLTRYLAGLWGAHGVRVNCLSPGGIGSDSTPLDFRERFEQRVPLGRMGTPGDLVGAVVWLLSSASEYVTGQEIRVDGGCGLWP